MATLQRLADAIEPEAFRELRRVAIEDGVITPDNAWASKRERRRDEKASAYRELRAWRVVWRKLGVRVKTSR
jgi:hypothetical protein